MATANLTANGEGRDLALFFCLPFNVFLDIRVIHIQRDHFGGTACGATGLDGPGGAVADFEETHQARGLPATRQRFAGTAQFGKVGASAGTVFEQTRLVDPKIHDATFANEVVFNRLNEAGVRLRSLVGGL